MINIFKANKIIDDLKKEIIMYEISNNYLANTLNEKEREIYNLIEEKNKLTLENYFLKRELESIEKGKTNE